MQVLKIVSGCLIFLLSLLSLVACGPNGRSAKQDPHLRKMDTVRGCVMESELMAKGIIGGQTVQPSDADSKLAVLLISDGMICTAAPINQRVLLTAAHCVSPEAGKTMAVFYPSLSCESGYDQRRNAAQASGVAIHEDFNPGQGIDATRGDVALVFLDVNIPEGYPIYNLADPAQVNSAANLTFYGYGRIESGGGGAGILRKTQLPGGYYRIDSTRAKVFLNQSNGTGICNGDSGGPSLVTSATGEWQILGINSYVVGHESDICGEQAVQTLAHSYNDWIVQKISEHLGNGER